MPEPDSSPVTIESERLLLTMPGPEAAKRQLSYFANNREHLAHWSPPNPPGFYSEEFWRWRLAENRSEYVADRSMRLSILLRGDPAGTVIGTANFSEIVRGPLQACFLGYSIDHRHQGRGLMKEALRAAIPHAFSRLNLHRIGANYVPTNERSGRLLRSLGFVVEGYARDYLYIDGAWRDHILTALTNRELTSPGVRG